MTDPPYSERTRTALRLTYRPYFWNSQSRLSRGHTWRVLSQREMQWKWKACYGDCQRDSHLDEGQELLLTLQIPQATVHSSLVADAWLA